MKSSCFLSVLVVLLVVAPAFGQDISNADLSQKVAELERRIALLEQLISATGTDQTTVPSKTQSENVANWRKMKIGMTEEAVRAILGEPLRIVRFSAQLYTWRYSIDSAYSQIGFGRNGVESWMEPE